MNLNDCDCFFSFCQKPLHGVYIWANKGAGRQEDFGVMVFNATFDNISVISWRTTRRAVSAHMNADPLLKNTSTKHNKRVTNQKLDL
jgi:hypothetical protein